MLGWWLAILFLEVFLSPLLSSKIILTITIINGDYIRGSTHAKVVFEEVLHPIELEFGNAGLWEEGKTGEPKEKPLGEE